MYILLASGDPAQHRMLSRLLQRERHRIDSVLTEHELFDVLERSQGKPDRLILGNFEGKRLAEVVLQDIRSKPYGKALPVLVHVAEDTITARAVAHIKELNAEFLPHSDFYQLNDYLK